ncbi:MAG TPA: hypothetical protein ENI23_00835 [bacterium]|nr:hypothetical protein [bacterium]
MTEEKTKMERKKEVLFTLLDDWEKLCRKSLLKLVGKKASYTRGYISGELNTIEIMKQFTEEARRK